MHLWQVTFWWKNNFSAISPIRIQS
jgi:hypothetical protein